MSKRKTRIVVQSVVAANCYAALVLGSGPKAYAGTAYPGHLTISPDFPFPVCDCTSTDVNCACIVHK
jgi:hypothetical protein